MGENVLTVDVETIKRVAKGCRIHNTLTRPPRIDVDLRVADGQSE